MKNSIESQQIGKKTVGTELESSQPQIIQRKRNVTLALSALLSSIGFMTGCNSPQASTPTSGQYSGSAYQNDPYNNGWITAGNRSILFSEGFLTEGDQSESEQPARPTLTREEFMEFVECYRLTPDETAQLGQAYEAMRLSDGENSNQPAPTPNK